MTDEVLEEFINIWKYISSEYKKDVYQFIFNMLRSVANEIIIEGIDFDEIEHIDIHDFLYDRNYPINFQHKFIPHQAWDKIGYDHFWGDFIADSTFDFLEGLLERFE